MLTDFLCANWLGFAFDVDEHLQQLSIQGLGRRANLSEAADDDFVLCGETHAGSVIGGALIALRARHRHAAAAMERGSLVILWYHLC